MSTISSNADISTKYQRVAAEYAKLKVQVAALKNAVIAEKEKSQKLSADLHNSESAVRKLQNEKEGFEFRNSQLVKRVESLQYEIDGLKQISSKKRGSFFHKNSRHEYSTAETDSNILQSELQKKVAENEALHKQISELENEYTETAAILNEQCRKLEVENDRLKEDIERIKFDGVANQSPTGKQSESSKTDGNTTEITGPYSSGNPNMVLHCERIVAVKETLQVLWLDALRMARTLTSGFANLLQLFEQRSTIYPNDIKMENLPQRTLLFGRQLLTSCDMFEACSSSIESILVKSADDDCLNLSVECSRIASAVADALYSCKGWQDLFYEITIDENRLSWCGPSLSKCNEDWTSSFLAFLHSLSTLSRQIEQAGDQHTVDLLVQVEKLPALFSDCSRAYAAKVFNENHIPTATKRLRCVNECIRKCLASLNRNMNSFVALVQLTVSSGQIQGKEAKIAVVENRNEASHCTSSDGSIVQSNDLKKEINQSGDHTYTKLDEMNSSSLRSTTDHLKFELERANKRIVELEKEKERIIVDMELLKIKLESAKSNKSEAVESAVSNQDVDVICSYFQERIGDLHADIVHIRSQAFYYKHECKDLVVMMKLSKEENETLQQELNNATAAITALKEELDMTRKTYEEQLQNLHEHIAELNIKLEEQSNALRSLEDALTEMNSGRQAPRKSLFK